MLVASCVTNLQGARAEAATVARVGMDVCKAQEVLVTPHAVRVAANALQVWSPWGQTLPCVIRKPIEANFCSALVARSNPAALHADVSTSRYLGTASTAFAYGRPLKPSYYHRCQLVGGAMQPQRACV